MLLECAGVTRAVYRLRRHVVENDDDGSAAADQRYSL